MKTFIILVTTAFIILMGSSSQAEEVTCLEQLEQKCTSCHYNTRICKKVEKYNKRKWNNTVKRMLRYRLKLDAQEQDKVVDCLLSLKNSGETFCK